MDTLDQIPQSAYDLIEALDAALPHRCIDEGQTPESAHRYAGARELVDALVALKEEEIESERTKASDQ